ncbi:MAG: PKD domain-containing protein [Sphingobacteriales bacterium]|nr:PKD domain-containing protein [Sphingobacteriales bacterium]
MKTIFFSIAVLGILLAIACNKDTNNNSNKPVAKFSISGYENPTPCTISFINISSNATSFEWNFGDGSTSTATNPTHTYNFNGSYLLKLKATGPEGSDSVCKLMAIEAPPPANKSAFSYYQEKCSGIPVGISFKTVNPLSTNVVWNFSNATGSLVERNPIIQFLLPGDYTITYSSQLGGVRDTVIRIIQIQ